MYPEAPKKILKSLLKILNALLFSPQGIKKGIPLYPNL